MTNKSHTYDQLLEQETLIADAAELICQVMEDKGINRQDLAARLGKSKGFVSQILTGERNMTLRTLADVLFALGHRFELAVKPLAAPRTYPQAAGSVSDVTMAMSGHRTVFIDFKSSARADVPWTNAALTTMYESLRVTPEAGDAETGQRAHVMVKRNFARGHSECLHPTHGRSDRAAGDPSDPRTPGRYGRSRL